MTQTTSAVRSGAERSRRAAARVGKHAPRPHIGRLALLVLILIGAAFYVAPLRDFFAQQDRYEKASARLQAAQHDNASLEHQIKLLESKAYIAQRARTDSMLVPRDTQVFVIKGLPGKEQEPQASRRTAPVEASISVLDRVEDLWRTLLR